MAKTPWLDNARADIGVHEVKGKLHDDRILEMLREIGHPEVQNDEDSWCATALGSWLVRSGLPTSKPVKLNRSGLSYEDYGTPCTPQVGAISVSTYTKLGKKDWRRHVGVITEVGNGRVKVLGGNTRDAVAEQWVPLSKVTATRWPPSPGILGATKVAAKSKSFWLTLSGVFWLIVGYIGDGAQAVFDAAMGVASLLPSLGIDIETALGTGEKFSTWLGIPFGKASVGLVVVIMAITIGRHVRDKINWGHA